MIKFRIYYFSLICFVLSSCDECKNEVCLDIPRSYFYFNLVDSQTGEDLIFGDHPINHPDSIEILAQYYLAVSADKENKRLGFFAQNDTFYIRPNREIKGDFWYDAINFDTLYFEFESMGMGKCCEEYKITKVYYNDSIYYPEDGVPVQLKKYQ